MINVTVAKNNEVDPLVHPKVNRFYVREEAGEKIFCVEKPVNNPKSNCRIVFEYPFDEIRAIVIEP